MGVDLRAYLTDLRANIDRRPNRLDSQALAHDIVAAMSDEEIGASFRRLTDDWEAALEHAGHPDIEERTTCPVDGQALPCEALRALAITYDVRPRS